MLANVSLLTPIIANHSTYHVPCSQDDRPRSDVATSATPSGVQSVSTGFKMMHVLYKRREKHLKSWLRRRNSSQHQQSTSEWRGTPTTSLTACAQRAWKQTLWRAGKGRDTRVWLTEDSTIGRKEIIKKGLNRFTLLNIPQRKNVHKLLFVFHLHTPHFFPLHPPLPYQPLHILVHYIHKPPTRQLYLQDPITFLCTFPTHLSLTSLTLSPNSSTWAVPQMRIFPILPILVTHSEILSMFNSATSSSTSRVFCQSYHCLKTIHDSGFH